MNPRAARRTLRRSDRGFPFTVMRTRRPSASLSWRTPIVLALDESPNTPSMTSSKFKSGIHHQAMGELMNPRIHPRMNPRGPAAGSPMHPRGEPSNRRDRDGARPPVTRGYDRSTLDVRPPNQWARQIAPCSAKRRPVFDIYMFKQAIFQCKGPIEPAATRLIYRRGTIRNPPCTPRFAGTRCVYATPGMLFVNAFPSGVDPA